MYKKWLERLNNELKVQLQMQTEYAIMRLTRRELIELKVIINTLKELDEIEEAGEE